MKKTYIGCARILPYLRPCQGCKHKRTCSLFYTSDVDWNQEAAKEDCQEEQKAGISESIVLGN